MMNGQDLQLGALLGEISAHGKAALHRFDRLDQALGMVAGDVIDVRRRVQLLEAARKAYVHPVERWLKRALTWGLPIGTLLATGSLEAAARVLKLVAGL